MQEKIYVRAVMLFIIVLIIAVIVTWYPILTGGKNEQASEVIPVSMSTSHLLDRLACEKGQYQSPIDIKAETIHTKKEQNFQLMYNPTILKIYESDKKLHAAASSNENFVRLGNEKFQLVDIHFHYLSEHTINGKQFAMEMHLVHENEKGDLAVVAALFQEGKENELLSEIFEGIPTKTERLSKPVDLSKMIQTDSAYHYIGSLTTPPCTEGVEWFILKEPFELSKQQLAAYTKNYPQNNRPIQQLNNREIKQIIINE